jgi:hypothetical protein
VNIHEQLLREHSKENTHQIATYIGDDPERFAKLMEVFTVEDWRPAQRGAWAVTEVVQAHPNLLLPHLDTLLAALENKVHPAVLRNGLKVIANTRIALTEEQEGRLVQCAFELLADPQVAVAIQVHAMQCIANLLPVYPDLAVELKVLLEEGMEQGSPGYRSRGRKVLKQIAKM